MFYSLKLEEALAMNKTGTLELSQSLEDYLETIYELVRDKKFARVKEIAQLRAVRPGSVSPAMRRLADLGLIRYEQREYIDLTPAGQEQAQSVLARHELLLQFLHDVLLMPKDLAQADACALEHSLSPLATRRLAGLLEYLTGESESTRDFLKGLDAHLKKLDYNEADATHGTGQGKPDPDA
jgi:DtxR family Mn-dependent transcriptional regulator